MNFDLLIDSDNLTLILMIFNKQILDIRPNEWSLY
jgi:hypothetical protein